MSTIKITDVDNGWIIEYPYSNGEGNAKEVYSYDPDYDQDEKTKALALRTILQVIVEQEFPWSKHRKFNVSVKVIDQNDKEVEDDA